jgi:hypothetical protein
LKTISIPKNFETFGITLPYSVFLTESTFAQKKAPFPKLSPIREANASADLILRELGVLGGQIHSPRASATENYPH